MTCPDKPRPPLDKRKGSYEEEGKAVDKKVTVTNQFGKQVLAVGGPTMLCVPSLKKLL